jgi:hypothetical protein
MSYKKQYLMIKVGINEADRARLVELARIQERTQTEVARDGIRWYLDNVENLSNEARESEMALAMRYATEQHVKAIGNGVERICKMLARQGTAIGTLYELTWLSLPDDELARATFEEAIKAAKQKMRRYVEKDEEEIACAMKKVVDGQ